MNKTFFFIQNGTVIGIPLSFNWDTMSITLKKMFDFTDIFPKIVQRLAFISKHSDHHSSLELLSLLELLP